MKVNGNVVKGIILLAMAMTGTFFVGDVYAAPVSGGIGTIADNVRSNFSSVAKLITAASYIAGFGFAFASILKFKAHKDNPQQVTVGQPIALLFIAAALIFLPSVFSVSGKTVFGGSGHAGSVSGSTSVPGFSKAT